MNNTMEKNSFLQIFAVTLITLYSVTLSACGNVQAEKSETENSQVDTQIDTQSDIDESEKIAGDENSEQGEYEVDYRCEYDRLVTVVYKFNDKGYPTSAKIEVDEHIQNLAINEIYSDKVDTIFGTESSYMLATDFMNKDNYIKKSILVTNPSQEIIYKDCNPEPL